MKKTIFIILGLFLINIRAFCENYNVYQPQNYSLKNEAEEKILFILDFSNSMSEYLENEPKYILMINTMKSLLSTLPPQTEVGLRVYGHRNGFTMKDACRASKNINSICANNCQNIANSLDNLAPSGMTPITYSLKQAVKYDFLGFRGKKHIILLTDGGENCDESPCTYAMELIKTRRDIIIDVIAFNISDEDDLAQLECASLVTSGKFYTANTACELANSLAQSLNSRKEVDAKIIQH